MKLKSQELSNNSAPYFYEGLWSMKLV